MKFIILFAIKCYWQLVPERKRRACIYQISCSCFVYTRTIEHGFWAGIKALKARTSTCKPGYTWAIDNNQVALRLSNGDVLLKEKMATHLLEEQKRIEQRILSKIKQY